MDNNLNMIGNNNSYSNTGNLPVNIRDISMLQNDGIPSNLCKLGTLFFESDKYICAKQPTNDGKVDVLIIDLENGRKLTTKTLPKADAAMMHPSRNMITVRAKTDKGTTLIHCFDFSRDERVKNVELSHDVTFWKWLNENTLGIVTPNSVFTLSIANKDEPAKKIFDKTGSMSNNNVFIMNLQADEKLTWFSLSGVASYKDQNTGKPVINGYVQLYNAKANQAQIYEAFCGIFGQMKVYDENPASIVAFIERKANSNKYNLIMSDIYGSGNPRFKTNVETPINFADGDFPVTAAFLEQYGLYIVTTNQAKAYIYEVTNSALIFLAKVKDTCLFSAKNRQTGGMYFVTKQGTLLQLNIEKQNIIPHIMNNCRNLDNVTEVCKSLAGKYNLPGAEKVFDGLFRLNIQQGKYEEAAKVCADSPGDTLRNIETINMFRGLNPQNGKPQPILIYFQTIMSKCRLNKVESIEIARPLVQSGKRDIIENWLKENKFTCSEELSDLVKQLDGPLSLKILVESGSPSAHGKIVEGLVLNKQFDKVFPYCQNFSYNPDYSELLNNVINQNPEAALGLAKLVCNRQTATYKLDVNKIIEIFESRKRIQELTSFLIEYLKDNRPEDSFLQTKVLELNLFHNPNAAQILFEKNVFSHYDKKKIANIAERMGLYQIALENYTDFNDIKRVMLNVHGIKPNFLVEYFGRLEPEVQVSCLNELLRSNPMQNLNIVVEIAVKYASRIPINELIKLFETNKSHQGLFLFINRIVNAVDDPEIMFKYIQSGVLTNNFNEVQRVVKDYDNYDPEKVLNFFLENRLVDNRPLIILCDKHDYVEKLALYLYKNKQTRILENYMFTLRPQSTPRILATLLDEDCEEAYIKQVLNTVRGGCPIEPLVEEFTKRHKLKVLQKFLEERDQEGNTTPALHNALAMIYIDINNNPKDYLINNKYYDSKVVGKFCEDRDPHLACIAYRRANGACDDEFIELTNKMALYRLQAQYLVESVNPDLWKKVLDSETEHKKPVVDQVTTVILPQTRNSDEVSVTVKAFIDAGLQGELMELLEKLVLHNNEFSKNVSLQNLLILTAITSAPQKVKGFLTRLDSYEGKDLSIKCLENNLFEEAFFIYDKMKEYSKAIEVIIDNMDDLKRATIYAEKINTKEVWSKIARAKLNNQMTEEAIEAFIKSEDADCYVDVINLAEREEKYEELIKYLVMAREIKKDKLIDGELVFSYAKCEKLSDLESFINGSNTAELGSVADRLYDQQSYKACKLLYESVGNNSRLASCLTHLKEYQKAVLAAKKANNPRCWKEVCFACVKGGEFRLAAQAGSNIIVHPDLVDELIKGFENYGAYSELISLFEGNLSQERNHIYTELAILYAKYNENKLMDYCRNYYEKFNVPKVIRICEVYQHWNEVVFLHCHYNGHDQAIEVMINHSPVAFSHDLFIQTLQKVSNSILFNDAIHFYIQEQPQLINDMLKVVSGKLDLSNTILEIRKTDYLPLFLPFLKSVQSANNYDVNEALNEILLQEENADSLKDSILEYSSFDQLSLAKKIENHDLLEFRRISALVYRKNKKYQQSIEISKKLEFFKDAIETAFESQNEKLCEDLLRYFASQGNKECFCSCLYTCYDLIKCDIAMELAWRYDFNEFLMPYMIQNSREMQNKLDYLQRKIEDTEKKEEKKILEEAEKPIDIVHSMGMMSSGLVPMGGMPNYGGNEMPNYGGNIPNNLGGMPNFSGNNMNMNNNNMHGNFSGFGGFS